MYTATSYDADESPAAQAARQVLASLISVGANEQKRLLEFCANNIPRDRYVPPSRMELDLGPEVAGYRSVCLNYKDKQGLVQSSLRVHKHALGQLSTIAGLNLNTKNDLNVTSGRPGVSDWRRALLCHILNTMFANQVFTNRKGQPAEFLHRIVGDELRAVLTQSYNRHLVSLAVLQPFLAVCGELGAQPVSATIADTRVSLQCFLPYVFQPIKGEFVALGASWGNSDFGQGRVKVSNTVLRVFNGGSLVTDDAFSRTHIGSVVEDTDLKLDDKVATKELEAVAEAIQATVRAALMPEAVKKLLDGITQAHEEKVPWDQLRSRLGKLLTKAEVVSVEKMLEDEITDLPPPGKDARGQPLPSRWWAAAALSHLASHETDTLRALEMKQAAGRFLESK